MSKVLLWTLEIVDNGAWLTCTDGTKLFYYDIPGAKAARDVLNHHKVNPSSEPVVFESIVDSKILNAVRMIRRKLPAYA